MSTVRKPRRNAMKDMTGEVHGRWTVLSFHERFGSKYYWNCRCSCGRERPVMSCSLRAGASTSCGCGPKAVGANLRHGHAQAGKQTAEYHAWQNMIRRCENMENMSYGGRGIRVCGRWNASFDNFIADMGRKPTGTSIERIDVNGNYEPSNCRWATRTEQENNKRNSHFCEVGGRRLTATQWAREIGVSPQLIYSRKQMGWSDEEAIVTPPNPKHRRKSA